MRLGGEKSGKPLATLGVSKNDGDLAVRFTLRANASVESTITVLGKEAQIPIR